MSTELDQSPDLDVGRRCGRDGQLSATPANYPEKFMLIGPPATTDKCRYVRMLHLGASTDPR